MSLISLIFKQQYQNSIVRTILRSSILNGESKQTRNFGKILLNTRKWQHKTISGSKSPNLCPTGKVSVKIAYYEEIKSLPQHPEKLLIDVREPEEVKKTGTISTSINIPLSHIKNVLSMMDEENFEKLYGIKKPSKEQQVIFHCMIGKRSNKASEIAIKLGYKKFKRLLKLLSDISNHSEKLLIDGRFSKELEETGIILKSINIPLALLEPALSEHTTTNEFMKLYERKKPDFNTPTIFSCHFGGSALMAYRIAEELGYKNIKSYEGSWLDWAERENLPKK